MSGQNDTSPKRPEHTGSPPPPVVPTAPPAALAADVENQTTGTGLGVPGILRRWKREDSLRRGSLALSGLSTVSSFLAFIIMASNKHGDSEDFNQYEEYSYVLAIAILSMLYSGMQAARHVHQLYTGREVVQRRTSASADFIGDQIMAYLLISSSSSAIPLTNRLRDERIDVFTDSSAAAISMAFLAFVALALSALISGYKLSSQSYI
ncbi:CASP-like protein 4B1 [Prunus yedoensis var. nudiflora]|uniref:CASP-like protein n=1 Tax=Prunus yedoensis var. nudiflora TaxID=2094558 RepID=A0A314Z0T5_PRUYE|nr:CASP-like protein 4B1 [Prunus yedoensis var. nudiflora]